MARTLSSMQALGTPAADFCLPDVTQNDKEVCLADFTNRPLLVVFICNHCPFVIHLIQELSSLANRFLAAGVGVVAISANDVERFPQDGPDQMREFAKRYDFKFPYCYDESQTVARAYGAESTPDFFVYNADHRLQYRGQFDDSRPGNGQPVSGAHLEAALHAVLVGEAVSGAQVPSIGCSIKWKSK